MAIHKALKMLRSFEIEGRTFSEIRIEQTYKGNYHLYATENGKERKFVIGKNKPEHALIQETGITNISDATLCEMLKNTSFSSHEQDNSSKCGKKSEI